MPEAPRRDGAGHQRNDENAEGKARDRRKKQTARKSENTHKTADREAEGPAEKQTSEEGMMRGAAERRLVRTIGVEKGRGRTGRK